jgi:hypothetical protein
MVAPQSGQVRMLSSIEPAGAVGGWLAIVSLVISALMLPCNKEFRVEKFRLPAGVLARVYRPLLR